jgi:hypothetical protein
MLARRNLLDAGGADRSRTVAPLTDLDRHHEFSGGTVEAVPVLDVHLPGVIRSDRQRLRVGLCLVRRRLAHRTARDDRTLPVVVVALEREVLLGVRRDLRLEAAPLVLRIEERVDPDDPVAVLLLLPDLDGAAHLDTRLHAIFIFRMAGPRTFFISSIVYLSLLMRLHSEQHGATFSLM